MNQKEATYTRPKTVRFDEKTFRRIEKAAGKLGMTTSAYIRHLAETVVNRIELDQEAS